MNLKAKKYRKSQSPGPRKHLRFCEVDTTGGVIPHMMDTADIYKG